MDTPAILALATSPDMTVRVSASLLTAPKNCTRRSAGKSDTVSAGQPVHVTGAGWGVTSTGKKERDQSTEEWVIRYAVIPPTDAQVPVVLAAMRARLVAEAQKIIGLPADDDRMQDVYAARSQRLTALVAAIQAEG